MSQVECLVVSVSLIWLYPFCVFACVCSCVHVCIRAHMHMFMCVYVCAFMCVCVCVHACLCVRVCLCVCVFRFSKWAGVFFPQELCLNSFHSLLFIQYYLKMDGRGHYEFKAITSDTSEFGSWYLRFSSGHDTCVFAASQAETETAELWCSGPALWSWTCHV